MGRVHNPGSGPRAPKILQAGSSAGSFFRPRRFPRPSPQFPVGPGRFRFALTHDAPTARGAELNKLGFPMDLTVWHLTKFSYDEIPRSGTVSNAMEIVNDMTG